MSHRQTRPCFDCAIVTPTMAPCVRVAALLLVVGWFSPIVAAAPRQAPSATPLAAGDYVVGAQDVLTITSYDQADLTGRFTVETDGTFAFPLIGRVRAGGLTLRQVEFELKKQLKDGGIFRNPQITVAIDQYRSQKIFIVGEVRTPGTYTLSGGMSLVEALARAGSTLPSSSGDAIIVHADSARAAAGPILPNHVDPDRVVRINLRDLEKGEFSQNTALRDGDTIFVPRAESVYVFGQVKNPGAYAPQQRDTTVLQALALAGGVTENASTNRIRIIRIEQGGKKEIRVKFGDPVKPGDTVVVPERYF